MKFEIDFDQSPDYVLIKGEGEASVEGFDNLMKALVTSPKWKPGIKQLADHRSLILSGLSSEEVRRLVNIVKQYSEKYGNGPCAFLVKDALAFGLARMYAMLGGEGIHPETNVFYKFEEAIEWLKMQ